MPGREETVDDKEIMRFIVEHEDPFVFTGDVADFLDFSTGGTLKRLRKLKSAGYLNVKKSGKVPGWWPTEAGREFVDEAGEG
jgi:Mn-dependent DtxR family transcriptional regulator